MGHLLPVTKDNTFKEWRLGHNELVTSLNLNTIGAVSVETVREMMNYVESAGIFVGCDVTDAGGGNVDVAGGEAFLRVGPTVDDEIAIVQVPPLSAITPTDNDITYIYASYNAGVPTILSSINANDFNGYDKCLIALVSREGTDVTILEAQEKPVDNSNRINQMMIDTHGLHHVSGGSRLSESGTRNFTLTEGAFYRGLKKYTHPAHDSAIDNFEYYYLDGLGGWTEVVAQSQIDNTNYDDGSGTLVALGANEYAVHWVYLKLGSNKHELYVLYGSASHVTVADARAEQLPPAIPPTLEEVGVLLGKIIIQKTQPTFESVETAFGASFIAGTPSNHENLSNLQGGQVTEHYHLTAAEHSATNLHVADVLSNPHAVTAAQVGADPEGEGLAMSIALG